MKKFFYFYLIILLSFSVLFPQESFAAKKKKKSSVITLPAIDAVNNNGEKTIFGSVLDPNENQVLFLLPKPLLNAIRKLGLKRLSINVTSALDSTRTFLVPSNGISVQLKRVQGKVGRYLVANISSLTTPSGITVSPSALPSDEYRLKVTEEALDITTNKFNYRTPTLLVGTVKSKSTGFVTVEDLNGNEISDKTVAINPNGTFITEVRANKLQSEEKEARKPLGRKQIDTGTGENTEDEHGDLAGGEENEASATEEETSEEIDIGIVHAVTNKDLFAVVPLDNDVETNAAIANKPIEIDDSSTLTANLGKEYEVIAEEIAKEELEQLESEEEITEGFEDFACDIYKFADRCNIASDEELDSIGADFREFTQTTDCAFPEYELIKSLIAASPEEANLLIGKGYCEFVVKTTEINEQRPCEAYSEILSNFKQGLISQLPCPPSFCKQFKNIKPPKCFEPIDFCEEEEISARATQGPSCVRRPIRDLYCARIGIDVTEEECVGTTEQGITPEGNSVLVTWVNETSSNGNNYCVPKQVQLTNFTTGVTEIFPEDPARRVEECETVNCHKLCEQGVKKELPPDLLPAISFTPNGQVCEVCNCHLACDAEAGRIVDCGNPESRFFASGCCSQSVVNSSFSAHSELKSQVFGGGFTSQNNPGFPPLIRQCICQSISNFNEKGFVTQEAIDRCKNKCPQGFEINQDSQLCLPICSEGDVRGPNGNCRKKCPLGFVEDDFGGCRCPEGQFFGRSGKCETVSCPDFCKNIPLVRKLMESHIPTGSGFTPSGTQPGGTFSPTSTSSNIPPECQGCFGGLGVCPSGQRKDPATGQCVASGACGTDQYLDQNGVCRCNVDGSIASSPGPEGCKRQTCSSNMLPNPRANEPNQAACICPTGLPYWDGAKCVAQCPGGNPPPSTIASLPLNSPVPCSSATGQTQCTGSTPYLYNGICVVTCPIGTTPGTYSFGSGPTATGGTCPPATPIKCPDGRCVATQPQCGSVRASSTGLTAILKESHGFGTQLECLCPGSVRPDTNGQCPSTQRYCGLSEIPNTHSCTCAPGATSPTGTTACVCTAPGQTYTPTGCYSSSNYCAPAISTTTGCTCGPGATPSGANSTCQCPNNTPAYTPAGCGGTSTRPCNQGEGPSNNCYCFGSGFTGTDGKCQCSSGITYTGAGCGTTTSNYCSPAIVPTAANPCTCAPGGVFNSQNICSCTNGQAYTLAGCGTTTSNYCSPAIVPTATNPCTCNPSGGSFFNSSNTCTCPSGSSNPYTKEYGCSSPTTTNYCAPAISTTTGCTCAPGATPSGANSTCQCPNNTPAYTPAGCGGTTTRPCNQGEGPSNNCYCFGGGFTGTDGRCQCSSGVTYTGAGCGTSQNYCAPAISTTTGCTCAPGATPSGANSTCQCTTAGQTYSSAGCGTTTTYCGVGIAPSTGNCTCAPGATSPTGTTACTCTTTGQTYTPSGCNRVCAVGEVYNASNPCTCAGSGYIYQSVCTCAAGQTYSATGCVSNSTITLTSVTISGSNVTISYSVDPYACLLVKDTNNTTIKPGNLCGTGSFNSVFLTADFTPTLVSGTQVKLCNQDNSSNCSSLVTVIGSPPSAPSSLAATLSSGNVSLTWVDNSSDETEFKISRRPSGGAWTQIATVAVSITSYTDTGLAAGTYDYHVNACNASGCSSDSNIVTITK